MGRRAPANALDTGFIVFWRRDVGHVLSLCSFAQIRETIIAPVSIDMINAHLWPAPSHIQKRQATRAVLLPIYADQPITLRVNGAGNYTSPAATDAPSEHSSVWVVIQKGRQSFGGQNHGLLAFLRLRFAIVALQGAVDHGVMCIPERLVSPVFFPKFGNLLLWRL